MVAIEPLAIVRLDSDDATAGLELSKEAGWNQNEADWSFFLREGSVFGMRDEDGVLIASAALLPYASGQAWISMVLVTARWRRRGVATRLLDRCLQAAQKQGLTPWLDATPAGAAVYGPLGFKPTLQLRRLRLEHSRPIAEVPQPPPSLELARFVARDTSAMGFDRASLLTELARRPGSRLLCHGDATALVRDGHKARHIGPLFADRADAALALVSDIVRSETSPLLIDAVSPRDDFLQGLTGAGWIIERPFQRMRFGRVSAGSAELPFAVAGPEFG